MLGVRLGCAGGQLEGLDVGEPMVQPSEAQETGMDPGL